jgi:hypothetical protein
VVERGVVEHGHGHHHETNCWIPVNLQRANRVDRKGAVSSVTSDLEISRLCVLRPSHGPSTKGR